MHWAAKRNYPDMLKYLLRFDLDSEKLDLVINLFSKEGLQWILLKKINILM